MLAEPNAVAEFSGKYRYLSNFWPCRVTLDGVVYKSVEHAFQAAKFTDPKLRRKIRRATHPGEAKRIAWDHEPDADWKARRVDVMVELVWQKFQDPELKERLLATGDRQLIEGNYWRDHFWGVCRGHGENWLGRILMEVRAELKGER